MIIQRVQWLLCCVVGRCVKGWPFASISESQDRLDAFPPLVDAPAAHRLIATVMGAVLGHRSSTLAKGASQGPRPVGSPSGA